MINVSQIKDAHERIKPYIHCTPILKSTQLNKLLGCELFFKAENLQKVGAFKARGACNAVFSLSDDSVPHGVLLTPQVIMGLLWHGHQDCVGYHAR